MVMALNRKYENTSRRSPQRRQRCRLTHQHKLYDTRHFAAASLLRTTSNSCGTHIVCMYASIQHKCLPQCSSHRHMHLHIYCFATTKVMHMSNIRLLLAHCMSRKLNGTHDNDHSYSIQLEVQHHWHRQRNENAAEKREEREGNQKIHLENVLTQSILNSPPPHTLHTPLTFSTLFYVQLLQHSPFSARRYLNTNGERMERIECATRSGKHKINDPYGHAVVPCIVRRRTVNFVCCCK